MAHSMTAKEIADLGWNLLREEVSLPAAILYEDKLRHNLQWMQNFADAYGAKLAPHGKTTVTPKLFAMQLQAGAWGITLATVPQVLVAYEHGVRRIVMANQLVGKQNFALIAILLRDPTFDFYCLVDSATNVEQLGGYLKSAGLRLKVLLELGMEDGRTGVRTSEQLENLLVSLSGWKQQIQLCGIEIYEGICSDESTIRRLLRRTLETARCLVARDQFARTPVILSVAGSAWYDVVAEELFQADLGVSVDLVLRPGCYITHDVGAYEAAHRQIKLRNRIASCMQSSLIPALQLWAYVHSVPEPTKAIVGLGKRDAAFDSGLPLPALHLRQQGIAPHPSPPNWKLIRMMDQHAFLQIARGDEIAVGDILVFDISHPCLTFDKWRYLLVLDQDYQVTDVVETFF